MHLRAAGMGQQSWGGRPGGMDLSTDSPDDTNTLLMHVSPSIDIAEGFHGLRIPADRLSGG